MEPRHRHRHDGAPQAAGRFGDSRDSRRGTLRDARTAVLLDRRAVMVGAGVIALQYLAPNFALPVLVFPGGGDVSRVLFHVVILVFEVAALTWLVDRTARLISAGEASAIEVARLANAGNTAELESQARTAAERRSATLAMATELGDIAAGLATSSMELERLGRCILRLRRPHLPSGGGIDGKHPVRECERMEQTSGIATATAAAVEEQVAATREIASSAQQAASGTEVVAAAVAEVNASVAETSASASTMCGLSGEVACQGERLLADVTALSGRLRREAKAA